MTRAEQIRLTNWRLRMVKAADEGPRQVAQTCRHYGISRQAFYKWKKRYREHGEAIVDLTDARRCPGRPLRFLPLGPRVYVTAEDNLAILGRDVDPPLANSALPPQSEE